MDYGFGERLTDKNSRPSQEDIAAFLGSDASDRLLRLELFLQNGYDYGRELKFPFGNSYGWGFRYSNKKQALCYAFFERGGFTVTLSIGKAELPRLQKILSGLLPKTQTLWKNRYPCGEGGWVHYQVRNDEELIDVEKLIGVRKKPKSGMQ